MQTKTVSTEEILFIHETLVRDFALDGDPIDPPGVKSISLLESAVGRQFTGIGDVLKYPNPIENAATLMYGICNDHPFHNGNKRTALVSLMAHLDKNNLVFYNVRQSTLYNLMLRVASHSLIDEKKTDKKWRKAKSKRIYSDDEVKYIIDFLRDHTRELKRGEKMLSYKALRRILKKFNIYLENPHKNQISVVRHDIVTVGIFRKKQEVKKINLGSISYFGENREVGYNIIKRVRKMCNLSEENGCDSSSFYDEESIIDSFINNYRIVLRRLGKV